MEFLRIILKDHVLKHQVPNVVCNFHCGKILKFFHLVDLGLGGSSENPFKQ